MNNDYDMGSLRGLTEQQAQESIKLHGSNIFTEKKGKSAWREFAEKFRDPIIEILIVAWALSMIVAGVQCWGAAHDGFEAFLEPIGIFFAIAVATVMSYLFERKANKEFQLLNTVNDDVAVTVLRDREITQVPRRDIAVGDIVILNTGDEVPADGVLLHAVGLQVNESSLTGEPVTVKTTDSAHFDSEATYPSNEVMRGSTVIDGHGVMRVQAVGDATAYGKVFSSVQIEDGGETPLQSQLSRLAKQISKVGYATAGAIFVILTAKYFLGGGPLHTTDVIAHMLHYFMLSVTLIVATVPEGLPMSVTLSLAMSMRRMLKSGNLVRKLHACETMGATTVICTDKTGTLTQNRMTVEDTRFPALGNGAPLEDTSNVAARALALDIAVNSTANLRHSHTTGAAEVIGNPTEGALLMWMEAHGANYRTLRKSAQVTAQLSFSTERKYMATVVRDFPEQGRSALLVKGAPEIVLGMCSLAADAGDTAVDIDAATPTIERELKGYQSRAMRTLGFAYKILDGDGRDIFAGGTQPQHGLTFLGIAAISDPVRTDVPQAIAECRSAGIDVKVVTGDTQGTAVEVARHSGILSGSLGAGEVMTGAEFEAMSDEDALAAVKRLKVMCRARPLDKQRLVRLLQQGGEVVAVTGDGTNDAPALKAAQVGLSMGDGTSVAKEASDITILDNSFAHIVDAVMWGRSLYKNIQRFLIFQLSVSLTACLVVFLGSVMGSDSPLTVTQMLYVNLIMDTFAAAAFASLPPTRRVMSDAPRKPGAPIITTGMWRWIAGITVAFTAAISALFFTFKAGDGLSVQDITVIFATFVMLQFWNIWNAKAYGSDSSAFRHVASCRVFVAVEVLIFGGLVLLVTFGGSMFTTTPLSLCSWLHIIVLTSPVLLIGELCRLILRLRRQ